MPILPIWTGSVIAGKLTLDDEGRFRNYVRSLEGRVVDLTLGKHVEKRSNPQNALYWVGYVQPLAEHYGWETDEMHDYLKRKFNPVARALNGREEVIGGTTTKLDRAEFTQYLDRIAAHFAAEGFTFPQDERVEVL